MFKKYLEQLKDLFLFSLPLVAGQVGQMLYGTGDIMVAGRYSNEVVAALGIAAAMMGPFIMVGLSVTYAVGSITAQYIGAEEDNHEMIFTSHMMSLVLGVALYFGLEIFINYIHLLNFETKRELLIIQYLRIAGFSLIPMLFFQVSKEYLQAHLKTYFANALIFVFLGINVFLNFIFMFGKWGFPEMGIEGAAYATTICRFLSAIVLFVYLLKFKKMEVRFNKILFKKIFKIGFPIGLGTFVEVLVFTTVTILIGRMSTLASASHNIVLNLASLTFMLPLAMNSAAGVKVGIQYGRKDKTNVVLTSLAALTISTICMICTASCYFLIPTYILRIFTTDTALIEYASGLIVFVAYFQIPDGAQVTLWGVLRGVNTTKTPMLITTLGNWLIGLPIGYYLAFHRGMEAKGLWAGLAIGLTCISFGLTALFFYRIKQLDQEFLSPSQ